MAKSGVCMDMGQTKGKGKPSKVYNRKYKTRDIWSRKLLSTLH
jgi:hypothetical protein